MSSSTNKPPKRLSLLQSTHIAPYGAGGSSTYSTTQANASSGSSFRSTRPSPLRLQSAPDAGVVAVGTGPSTAPLSESNGDVVSPDSPALPRSAAAFARSKVARRQSSICYIPSTDNAVFSDRSPKSSSPKSLSPPASASLTRADRCRSAIIDSKTKSALRNELALGRSRRTGSVHLANGNQPASPPARELQPVTLAERHADLLHFIAQKESKCLELRAQLATHETELLELKRKWERIVSRGFVIPSSSAASDVPPSASSAASLSRHARSNTVASTTRQTSVIGTAGLRESVHSVQRFIAGLGDSIAEPTSGLSLSREYDLETASSASPSTSTATSVRLSQSSMSSLASACEGGSVIDACANIDLKQSTTAPATRLKAAKNPSSPPTPPSPTTQTLTSSSLRITTKAPCSPTLPVVSLDSSGLRRRRSAGHKPSVNPLSRVSHSPLNPEAFQPSSASNSTFSPSFPPPTSIIGLSALASLTLPSSSSYAPSSQTLNSSKRTTQPIQTLHSVHKRASAFLADASTSLFAALGSPQLANFGSLGVGGNAVPHAELRAEKSHGGNSVASVKNSVGAAMRSCAPALPLVSGSTSLLDDDEDGFEGQVAMTPDQPLLHAGLISKGQVGTVDKKSDEGDDWAW